MPGKRSFTIISVAGAHSMAGKTTLCAVLLKELNGFGAIKFTRTSARASMVEDVDVLKKKGKDTALLLGSGAKKVVWVRSPYAKLEGILGTALGRMKGLRGVIVEGNSPVDFLDPHLILFIETLTGGMKPSARRVSRRAHVLIVNSDRRTEVPPLLREEAGKGCRVFWIDLKTGRGELRELLRFVKEKIKTPHQRRGIGQQDRLPRSAKDL